MRIKIFLAVFCLTLLGVINTAQAYQANISDKFLQQKNQQIEQKTHSMEISQNNITLRPLPPLIDREIFFSSPEIFSARLSPDGKYISFLKPLNGIVNIWVKGIDEPFEKAYPVTSDTERPIFGYFWSQDSQYLLYVQDSGGDENYHVYAVSPTPSETGKIPQAKDLTPYEGIQAQILAVPEKQPDTIIIGLNDRDPRYHDVHEISISQGTRKLLIENDSNIDSWLTDWDGKVRLATRPLDDGGKEILKIEGDKFTPVTKCAFEETCSPLVFHKDGKRVYFETNQGEDVDLSRLVLMNPETGKIEEIVDEDPLKQVDFGDAVFSELTKELIFTTYNGDRLRIYAKKPEYQKDLDFLTAEFPDGDLGFQSITKDEKLAIVSISSDTNPGSTYLFDRNTRKLTKLYDVIPQLKSENLASMQPVRYQAQDGLEIPAYLTIPRNLEPRNLPVIIMPHGGPWARDSWGYDDYAQFFANRGYAVFQPNFRGSTGYGKKFLNAGNKEWGTGAMQQDITDGVRYLIDKKIADPERIGIFGASYGGYATLAGLAFTPDIYAAGISYVGPSNIITLYESLPAYWEGFRREFQLRVGNPEEPQELERLKAQSPLFSAKNITAPLMVIQGANDPRVKKAESDQIVVALRDLGRDVEYILATDEGHGFAGETNKIAVSVAIEKFWQRYLQGRRQESVAQEVKQKLEELTVDIKTVTVADTGADTSQ
jgi:dipeptidyl aminopeptidase/acylaminoacyl peptidase